MELSLNKSEAVTDLSFSKGIPKTPKIFGIDSLHNFNLYLI